MTYLFCSNMLVCKTHWIVSVQKKASLNWQWEKYRNQKPLVIKIRMIDPCELGVVPWNVILSPFSAPIMMVGRQEGHPAWKNCMLACWWWRLDGSFSRLMTPAVTITSIILAPTNSRMVAFCTGLPELSQKWPLNECCCCSPLVTNHRCIICWSFILDVYLDVCLFDFPNILLACSHMTHCKKPTNFGGLNPWGWGPVFKKLSAIYAQIKYGTIAEHGTGILGVNCPSSTRVQPRQNYSFHCKVWTHC